MFKINIPITKSYTKKSGDVLVIEGFASDSTIDRDSERFSDEAVLGMEKYVNNGGIPIKVEHENKFYSEIGIWKEATMIDDKLFVKGEIDLKLSMGKDVEVLLNKGMVISLSVGGSVVEAVMEYSEKLGKMIKTYISILLEEISIVKNPANYNATLSLAKSYNCDKKQETEEGIKLNNILKDNKNTMTKKVDVKKTETETEVVEVTKEVEIKEEVEVKKETINTSELIKTLETTLTEKISEVEKGLGSIKELETTLTKKINEVEETLTKSITEVKEANAETLTKSTDASKISNDDMKEDLEAIVKTIGILSENFNAFGKTSNVRKSQVATIEKGADVKKSTSDLISAEMKVNGGNFGKARVTVLTQK